ncbi:MAG: metallophosphatase family protein [Actinomycetota bacterium]|nr:metallophosphatase family protein [Actinomycetota bacterium]
MTALRVVVLADTHMRAGSSRRLPERARAELAQADVILHAGDIVDATVLDALAAYASVHAVLGNNDLSLVGVLPRILALELASVRIGMIHDSGPRRGRAARLHRLFPDADIVVFGHSHVPVNETGVAGQLLFNPGSPTERRREPHGTIGILELEAGHLLDHRIEIVSDP